MGPVFPWTPEIEDEIWDGIMSGIATQVLLGPDRATHLPTERTFYRRLARDKEFQDEYLMAKQADAHRSVDEIREIADAATPLDYNVARLKVDARKWYASKTAPQYYGEKQSVEHSGAVGLTVVLDSDADKL